MKILVLLLGLVLLLSVGFAVSLSMADDGWDDEEYDYEYHASCCGGMIIPLGLLLGGYILSRRN